MQMRNRSLRPPVSAVTSSQQLRTSINWRKSKKGGNQQSGQPGVKASNIEAATDDTVRDKENTLDKASRHHVQSGLDIKGSILNGEISEIEIETAAPSSIFSPS